MTTPRISIFSILTTYMQFFSSVAPRCSSSEDVSVHTTKCNSFFPQSPPAARPVRTWQCTPQKDSLWTSPVPWRQTLPTCPSPGPGKTVKVSGVNFSNCYSVRNVVTANYNFSNVSFSWTRRNSQG